MPSLSSTTWISIDEVLLKRCQLKASFEHHFIAIETQAKGQDNIMDYQRKHIAMAGQEDDIAIATREDAPEYVEECGGKGKGSHRLPQSPFDSLGYRRNYRRQPRPSRVDCESRRH